MVPKRSARLARIFLQMLGLKTLKSTKHFFSRLFANCPVDLAQNEQNPRNPSTNGWPPNGGQPFVPLPEISDEKVTTSKMGHDQ